MKGHLGIALGIALGFAALGCAKGVTPEEYRGPESDGAELRVQVKLTEYGTVQILGRSFRRSFHGDSLEGSFVETLQSCTIFSPKSWSCKVGETSPAFWVLDNDRLTYDPGSASTRTVLTRVAR